MEQSAVARRSPAVRRRTRTFGAALLLGILALALTTASVLAGRTYCRSDPVVTIGGSVADVFVDGPLTAPLKVTGPTQVVVTVPNGVDAHVVATDLGFGRGEVAVFRYSSNLRVTAKGIQVRVQVYVPATDSSMPIQVNFAPRIVGILWPAYATGTANTWITLNVVFSADSAPLGGVVRLQAPPEGVIG